MKKDGTAVHISKWISLSALFLITLAPLVVPSSYFFPFITGKAFFFRILVEIAVCAWVVLAFLDKEYRPRFSWIGGVVLAFTLWMFVADCFAINPMKAFWSNFERMEGWVLLIHLFGFFVVASSVLRVEKKWRAWFLASLGVSVVVSLYAILQVAGVLQIHQGSTRIDATFGNSAYLAIYFLFNVFIALWLAFSSKDESGKSDKQKWLKWSLITLAAVEAVLIFLTETRGAILGLVGALALVALLVSLTAGKRFRRFAMGAFAGILILSGIFYLARNSSVVQQNHVLHRIASISPADGQTRFTIWHIAFQGVAERPIVGWGQEGFNYVFSKYFDPSLYQQEAWFDRAHNAFIDWLIAGGVPAFILYLSLFVSAIILLWKRSELARSERIFLTAALVGYACHNLFVFDNLYSYIYFFAILALIDSQIARPFAFFEHTPELSAEDGTLYALPVALVAACTLIWTVNVSGINTSSKLIAALSTQGNDLPTSIALFEDLAAHPSFASQEIREQLVSYESSVVQNSSATNEEKQKVASLAISEMQKQTAEYPLDVREHLELFVAYRTAGDNENASKEMETAIKLSPKKETTWIQAGVFEMAIGNIQMAQADFNVAYLLGPQFSELAAYAAAGDIMVGDKTTGDKLLLGAYGTTTVDSDILAVAYYRTKDWQRLINLWVLRVNNANASVQTWFGLASAYYVSGDTLGAVKVIKEAVQKYPEAAQSGAAIISEIEKK